MHGNREDCILFVVRGPSLCWRQISWCQTTQLLQNNVRYRLSKELYPQFSNMHYHFDIKKENCLLIDQNIYNYSN